MPNNKVDIVIRDNERGTRMLIDVAISGDSNAIKKEADNDLKYKGLTKQIQPTWKYKSKSDTSNTRGDWDHHKIIQKIPEQHNWKVRHQGTTQSSHMWHCEHTPESTNVKVLHQGL